MQFHERMLVNNHEIGPGISQISCCSADDDDDNDGRPWLYRDALHTMYVGIQDLLTSHPGPLVPHATLHWSEVTVSKGVDLTSRAAGAGLLCG
jgi:hypothetical protein